MNEDVLAAFLAEVFIPFVPFIGGFVFFMTIMLIFLVMLSWFLPEGEEK